MRASRLLSILLLLQVRGRISAQALADELEISVRTVYRDMDALSAAGVPVYGDAGPGGGFTLLDDYRSGLTGLSSGEAQSLLLSGFPDAVELAGLNDAAAIARLKLQAAMLPRAPLKDLSARLHLDPVPWYRRPALPRHLQAVAAATFEGRQVEVDYESWSRSQRMRLNPLGLVLKAGTWYLVAAAAKQDRAATYRVASIREAMVLDAPACIPADFSLADYWAESCERFERSLRRHSAKIRVAPDALARVRALGSAIEDAVAAVAADGDGWRTATVPVESMHDAAHAFLSLGVGVVVLAPEELRERMERLGHEIAAAHSKGREMVPRDGIEPPTP